MEPQRSRYPRMREVVFHITAPTLEELQHEALIEHLGPAHCTVRVRVRRGPSAAVSGRGPLGRPAALCR